MKNSKKPMLFFWGALALSAWCTKVEAVEFGKLWTNPIILSAQWQDAWVPQIVVDFLGNGLSLWYQYDNEIPRIKFSRYLALSGIWTPIGNVETLSAADKAAIDPQLAVDSAGNALAVWTVANANFFNKQIQSAYYNASLNKWTPIPQLIILSRSGNEASSPQIAVDSNGNGIAVWQIIDDSGTWTVQAARYDAAAHDWVRDLGGQPMLKNVSTGVAQVPFFPYPQISMSSDGNAIIVWQKKDGLLYRVESTVFKNSDWATWDPAALREYLSSSTSAAYWPNMAMDSAGNATVVWQLFKEYLPGNFRETVQAVRYSSVLQDWIRSVGVPVVKNIETYDVSGTPQSATTDVAMDSHGNSIIVWQGYSSKIPVTIHSTRYPSSASWSSWLPGIEVISDVAYQSIAPRIFMDQAGNGIGAWLSVDDNVNLRVTLSYYDQRKASWLSANELLIISPAGHDGRFEQIAMDLNGDALIVWQESDGINYRIWSSTFERVLRPQNLRASQSLLRFARQADLINVIQWDLTNPEIESHELYADGPLTKLLGAVRASCPSVLYHHCRKPCVQDSYYLIALDQYGNRSKPTYVSVPR